MERNQYFKKVVLKALYKGAICREEAKECLIRGFGTIELPLFFEFEENDPLKAYIQGLEKMGIIEPLFRTDGII